MKNRREVLLALAALPLVGSVAIAQRNGDDLLRDWYRSKEQQAARYLFVGGPAYLKRNPWMNKYPSMFTTPCGALTGNRFHQIHLLDGWDARLPTGLAEDWYNSVLRTALTPGGEILRTSI